MRNVKAEFRLAGGRSEWRHGVTMLPCTRARARDLHFICVTMDAKGSALHTCRRPITWSGSASTTTARHLGARSTHEVFFLYMNAYSVLTYTEN